MTKSERFGMLLSPSEKAALEELADRERISAAAVVRRLVWKEADRQGLIRSDQNETIGLQVQEVSDDPGSD